MQAQPPTTNDFRIMLLADPEAGLGSTSAFVRSLAGDDAHVFVLPYVRGIASVTPFALDVPTMTGDGAPITVLSPLATDGVAELARKQGADLIVVATSCDPDGRVHDPCGAAQLALDSPIPVLVLRRQEGGAEPIAAVRRLVVPLDGSARAAQALPFTLRLARRLDVPVQLVMVIDPERVIPPAYAYDPEAMHDALTDLREMAHWALKQAEGWIRRERMAVNSVLLYGPVHTCLRSAIEPGDLVLMTTHGTGRASSGSKLGSVAARMLETVTSPLVIMRGTAPGETVVDGYVACPWVEPLLGAGTKVRA